MKSSLLLLTAFSLLYAISASSIARDRFIEPSLLIRAEPIPDQRGPEEPKYNPGNHPVEESQSEIDPSEVDPWDQPPKTTEEKIDKILEKLALPKWLPKWGSLNPIRMNSFWVRGSPWKDFAQLYLPRTRFRGTPTQLFEVDEDGRPAQIYEYDEMGRPTSRYKGPVDLSLEKANLRQFEKSLGEGKEKSKILFNYNSKFPKNTAVTADEFNDAMVGAYSMEYHTNQEGVDKWTRAQELLKMTSRSESPRIKRRSDFLDSVSNVKSSSATENSTQDAATLFEQYFEVYTTLQASVAALISPVLHNFTSQTNLTIVHQMAESVFYDITGSTTALNGPFNYGVSFLSNNSNVTTDFLAGQGTNNATLTFGNSSDVNAIFSILGNFYAAMWVQALTAANCTGLYAQQIHIANCLLTNDTSVYPAGFTTMGTKVKADF